MKPFNKKTILIIGKEYFYGASLTSRGIYLGNNSLGFPIFKPTNETHFFKNKEGNVSCLMPVETSPATQEEILTAKFFTARFGLKFSLN